MGHIVLIQERMVGLQYIDLMVIMTHDRKVWAEASLKCKNFKPCTAEYMLSVAV